MKNPKSWAGFGVLKNHCDDYNLRQTPEKSNTTNDLARRDAAAMVHILNNMKAGFHPFECVYESLKGLHGDQFEYYFREYLSGRIKDE